MSFSASVRVLLGFGEAKVMAAMYLHYYSSLLIQIVLRANLRIISFRDRKERKNN